MCALGLCLFLLNKNEEKSESKKHKIFLLTIKMLKLLLLVSGFLLLT